MTSIERVINTFNRKPVDMIPICTKPWNETKKRWRDEGHIGPDEDVWEHFKCDMRDSGGLDSTIDLDFKPVILEETDQTVLKLDGNGAKLRKHKLHEGTAEAVGFTVRDRASWEEYAKPRLVGFNRRRITLDQYRFDKKVAAEKQRFLSWNVNGPFEMMHPICGHENLLMGMALDPDWVKDMVDTYTSLIINHLEVVFAEEGKPDGLFINEDLGFKFKPFMSPAMYREIMQPGHTRIFAFAHSMGCRMLVHSCGYVEPLIPGFIEAGMDCLQGMEVKAGMDLPTLFSKFGDKIVFYGGIDARTLISNDKTQIDEELKKKIPPVVSGGGGYILHTDHSEPPEVDYETELYFVDRARQIAAASVRAIR